MENPNQDAGPGNVDAGPDEPQRDVGTDTRGRSCQSNGLGDTPLDQSGVSCQTSQQSGGGGSTGTGCAGGGKTIEGKEATIKEDTGWSGCLQVKEPVKVIDGAELSISAGASITFDAKEIKDPERHALIVKDGGSLQVNGKPGKSVSISGDGSPGSWGGIRFKPNVEPSRIAHATISHAGGFDWNSGCCSPAGIMVGEVQSKVTIANVTISESKGFGIDLLTRGHDPNHDKVTLSNLTFVSNEMGAANVSALQADELSAASTFKDDQEVIVGDGKAGGTLEQSATWSNCVPYVVTDSIIVQNDATLTLQPGVDIRFEPQKAIRVRDGNLKAAGAPKKAIVLSGHEDNRAKRWGGVYFAGSAKDTSVLDHVLIEEAGGNDWNTGGAKEASIAVRKANEMTLEVAHSVIRNSGGWGFFSQSNEADITFDRNRFAGNEEGAANIPAGHMDAFQGTSAFEDDQNIRVRSGSIQEPSTIRNCLPFEIYGGELGVAREARVDIKPGVDLKFASGSHFKPNGGVRARGTAERPIHFRGIKSFPGAWRGMFLEGLPNGEEGSPPLYVFEHVVVEHGGNHGWRSRCCKNANVNVRYRARFELSDVTIRESSNIGMYFVNASQAARPTDITCEDVDVSGNPPVSGVYSSVEDFCNPDSK
jgi:hypothetical protein